SNHSRAEDWARCRRTDQTSWVVLGGRGKARRGKVELDMPPDTGTGLTLLAGSPIALEFFKRALGPTVDDAGTWLRERLTAFRSANRGDRGAGGDDGARFRSGASSDSAESSHSDSGIGISR